MYTLYMYLPLFEWKLSVIASSCVIALLFLKSPQSASCIKATFHIENDKSCIYADESRLDFSMDHEILWWRSYLKLFHLLKFVLESSRIKGVKLLMTFFTIVIITPINDDEIIALIRNGVFNCSLYI